MEISFEASETKKKFLLEHFLFLFSIFPRDPTSDDCQRRIFCFVDVIKTLMIYFNVFFSFFFLRIDADNDQDDASALRIGSSVSGANETVSP